ncbi:LysM peptidoglycan-binding domain-containing protein [Thioalkalivibrio sp. ALJ24]|uniref:LysM peptidoglycan-binding domain-containing protein n=1 Tax=Thioalkalivibrio sp. ALJ24 TaxID=545276 RepID=UPI000365177B|nr:LysM peptidoglycan-binding domain-containing protein [Thioalkalivibrio sp. ALJ24]
MDVRRWPLTAVLLAALAWTGGCALLEEAAEPKEETGQTDPTAAPEADEEDAGEGSSLAEILRWLQAGDWERAETGLDHHLEDQPDDPVARSLREQLERDPETLVAEGETVHTVESGDTLGLIARRYAGDATRFVALARLNDINRPGHLTVGQELRVPQVPDREDTDEPEHAPDLDEQLQALDAGADGGSAKHGDDDPAIEPLERAREADPEGEPARSELSELRRDRAERLHSAAIVHYRNQNLERAIELWDATLELDPDFESAQGYRLRALELKRRLEALD